jgi:kumamolisin
MIDELAELKQLLDKLCNVPAVQHQASLSATNPCDVWKALRLEVVAAIGLLNEVGVFIPQAKLAAEVLAAIQALLDQLCHVSAPSAAVPRAVALSDKLQAALAGNAAEPPCDVWKRLRPVVIDAIAALKALAAEVPVLGQVATVLATLQGLADALCGLGPQATPCGTAAAIRIPHGKARDYIRYPSPAGLRPRTGGPFRVGDLCKAYNFPTGLTGGGVVGILELGGGFNQSDLTQFANSNGLPSNFTANAKSVGAQNSPGGDADGEVLLDIQVVAAAYFYCTGQLPTINVYFAPNSGDSFVAVMKAAVSDGCDVLSISWGGDESGWDATAAHAVETQAAATLQAGCVIFAASGDNASGDSAPGANVDMPSSCPHIVGCGGTTKMPGSETVWGDGVPNGRGTGGGYSILFPRPTWQQNAPNIGGTRMVPDVAADADPDTGYLIVINGQETPIGGTSAVAPLYSGLFAAFGRKLGTRFQFPDVLWQHPECFTDIIKGSNGSFQAAPGPDPCTGLGVPIGTALAPIFR